MAYCKNWLNNLLASSKDFVAILTYIQDRREGGGVGRVRGLGPAKVLFNVKIDCSLGPGAMKYPRAQTESRQPCIHLALRKQNKNKTKNISLISNLVLNLINLNCFNPFNNQASFFGKTLLETLQTVLVASSSSPKLQMDQLDK